MRVLVGPAHWGGRTHQLQLTAVVRALADEGHRVTYATHAGEPSAHYSGLPDAVEVVVAANVAWPAELDLELALRVARGEPEWQVRVDLVCAAADAAQHFFDDLGVRQLLSRAADFDLALVDAGSLAGHLLADALHPVRQVHFLCYPYRPPSDRKAHLLEATAVQRRVATRLATLRASIGAPPKPQCAHSHVLTLVGHSLALHQDELPPSMQCVGSVLPSPRAESLSPELGAWCDAAGQSAAGGFVVVSLGSWGDAACSRLGCDGAMAEALQELGMHAIWKTRAHAAPRDDAARPCPVDEGRAHARTPLAIGAHVRMTPWLPQRALVSHPHCRLLVTHGGANSIGEACACAVPIVALPIGWDQPANAAIVADLELGRALPLASCTADALLEAMRAVLDDENGPRRAAQVADAMKAADSGAKGAVEWLERAAHVAWPTRDAGAEDERCKPERAPPARDERPATPLDEEAEGWGDALD